MRAGRLISQKEREGIDMQIFRCQMKVDYYVYIVSKIDLFSGSLDLSTRILQ